MTAAISLLRRKASGFGIVPAKKLVALLVAEFGFAAVAALVFLGKPGDVAAVLRKADKRGRLVVGPLALAVENRHVVEALEHLQQPLLLRIVLENGVALQVKRDGVPVDPVRADARPAPKKTTLMKRKRIVSNR